MQPTIKSQTERLVIALRIDLFQQRAQGVEVPTGGEGLSVGENPGLFDVVTQEVVAVQVQDTRRIVMTNQLTALVSQRPLRHSGAVLESLD